MGKKYQITNKLKYIYINMFHTEVLIDRPPKD